MTMASSFLSASQLNALSKIGDIYLPGDGEFPSFSELGCLAHVDDMLQHTDADDLKKLQLLLSVLDWLPASFLSWSIVKADGAYLKTGPLPSLLRELEFGLGGIVKSLYFSGRCGPDYSGPLPLKLMRFDPSLENR